MSVLACKEILFGKFKFFENCNKFTANVKSKGSKLKKIIKSTLNKENLRFQTWILHKREKKNFSL